VDFYDRVLLFIFACFNIYILWRVDKLERDKTDANDIKYIFELLLEKLGVYDTEYDEEED
jgi:hypothetical protein